MAIRQMHSPCNKGLTLVELMVSMLVGLIIVLAATSLLLAVQRTHSTQDDLLRIDENARFALEVVTRTARHAGFEDIAASHGAPAALPAVLGMDAATLRRNSPDISSALPAEVNGSDVLAIRHASSGAFAIPNCAGFHDPSADEERYGWSIFYVARAADGEPQLYCKYEGKHGWNADAVASGVEGFQVLYGVDSDEDGLPDRLLSASEIGEPNPDDAGSPWRRVVMVRLGILLRGSGRQLPSKSQYVHDLFGPAYSEEHGTRDKGVQLNEADLIEEGGSRLRRVVQATAYLRNGRWGATLE